MNNVYNKVEKSRKISWLSLNKTCNHVSISDEITEDNLMAVNLVDETEFRNWLLNELGTPERMISDYVSRCKRIQREFSVNLKKATETERKFSNLTKRIYQYSMNHYSNSSSAYANSANLKLAMRKYAVFIHGYDEEKLKYLHTFKEKIE